ncbi:2-phospho-L-lactate guanylyltransferase [Demequina salsinemoris]|uniref:2-phospho-L-lactate guanylyltransferase n=1 Tax=Demequina salsinemoris TaxID=577470 RepID=UPI0007834D0B|nr:2-phospho-L-lactate guanylyltransferase [Demequina salsinemoris]
MPAVPEPAWQVVVPVRGTAPSKSRLALPDEDRERLARAFARDTVRAVLRAEGVTEVVVVTAEAARDVFEGLGARVITDPQPPSLSGAIAAGLGACEPSAPRAVLLGDLPALTGAALDVVLVAAAEVDRGVVPDAEGTGTTLLTAGPGIAHAPAFGAGSRARHLAAGYAPLESSAPTRVRADVDTLEDLARAADLGLGPATRRALAALADPAVAATPVSHDARTVGRS